MAEESKKVQLNVEESAVNLSTDYSEIEDKDEVSPLNESSPLIHAVNSDSEHERTGTVFSSIFTLVSTMVGGGILSLPFAFQEGGFIITSIILFCVLMASTHGAFLVINSKRYCQGKITNIEDVANIAFGNKGKVDSHWEPLEFFFSNSHLELYGRQCRKDSPHCLALCSTDNCHVLDHASTGFQLKIKEAIHIQREQPSLNQQLHHILTQMVIIVTLFLCSVAYWILITDQIEPIIVLLCGPHSVWSKKIVILTIPTVVIFPITLLKSMSALRFTSVLSVICVVFLSGVVIYKSIINDVGGPVDSPKNPLQLWPDGLRGLLTAISIAGLTFSCHFNILPMHGELRYQTRANKRIILYTAMGITYTLNVLVSFFGFFQFRQFTDQDITRNYPHDDFLVNVGRVALALTLLLSFPLLIFPCRNVINRLIWRIESKTLFQSQPSMTTRSWEYFSNATGTGPSQLMWLIETGLLVFIGYILAYYIPQVAMVWGFVGAIGTTILIYILPPAFYLRVRLHPPRPDLKQIAAWGLMLTGFAVLVVCTYQSFANVIDPIPKLVRPHDLSNQTTSG